MIKQRKIYLNGSVTQANEMLAQVLDEYERLQANPTAKSHFETEEQYQRRMKKETEQIVKNSNTKRSSF